MSAWVSSWRQVVVLALCATCNGSLRFDENSPAPDAGSALDLTAAEPPRDQQTSETTVNDGAEAVVCTDASCHFDSDDCPGPECAIRCPVGGRCAGSCGDSCAADCEQQSTCSLDAGSIASIKCEQDAGCQFTVGAGTTVECWSRSSCVVHCAGACVVECANTATCRLACAAAALAPVTGRSTCP